MRTRGKTHGGRFVKVNAAINNYTAIKTVYATASEYGGHAHRGRAPQGHRRLNLIADPAEGSSSISTDGGA